MNTIIASIAALVIIAAVVIVWRILKPDDKWDVIDRKSEYALPCGHIRGAHWDSTRKTHACNVCEHPVDFLFIERG